MKRNCYSSLAFAAVVALGLMASSLAVAQDGRTCPGYTPNPNSVIVTPRVWGDCPASTLTIVNNYPALVSISDTDVECFGWTNLHLWNLSENGVAPAEFENCSHYRLSCVFNGNGTQVGPGAAEGGLRISPWWSDTDGRFNVRIGGNGEIAAFGGRLPFYSFTAAQGVAYVPGTDIWMEVVYTPNDLLGEDPPILHVAPTPATIIYKIFYQGVAYSSPELEFDMANPAEDPPHGVWGELYPAHVGGHLQAPNQADPRGGLWSYSAKWQNIQFEGPTATPSKTSTWGQLKSIYR